MKRRGFSLAIGSAIAATALVLAGCTSSGGGDESPTVLRIAQGGEDAIDFSGGFKQDPELSLMAKAIYDSLFTSEDGGTDMTPGLATEWSYDDARTTLTLQLREGVTFSDGSAFDAQDVKDTLDWIADQPEASTTFGVFYEGSEVTDEHTLVIHQTQAQALVLLNVRRYAITSSEAIADPDSMVTDPIGTGPYVLNREDSIEASSYVFDKRDDAWEADTYPFDQLVFNLVGIEPSASVNALRAGQVDFVAYTDGSTAESLVADGYEAIPYYFVYWTIVLDASGGTVPALADVRVRQAINYAFDRQGIVDGLNYGYGNPTAQIEANPDGPMYRPDRDEDYAYDLDRAKELLAEAGYPDGFDMSIVSIQAFKTYRPVIEQTFADLGINLEYVEALNEDKHTAYMSGKYSAAVFASTPGEASIDYAAGSYNNPWAANTTPELTELLATLDTGSEDEVKEASAAVGDFLLDEAYTVMLAHPQVVQIGDPKVVAYRDGYKSWLGQIPLRAMIPAE
jgi:peptide/nickel transport system substrate-binding protein